MRPVEREERERKEREEREREEREKTERVRMWEREKEMKEEMKEKKKMEEKNKKELMEEARYWEWNFPPNPTLEQINEHIAEFDEEDFQKWKKRLIKICERRKSEFYLENKFISISSNERELFRIYIENEVVKKNLPKLKLDTNFFANLSPEWPQRLTDPPQRLTNYIRQHFPSKIEDILYQIKRRINIRDNYLDRVLKNKENRKREEQEQRVQELQRIEREIKIRREKQEEKYSNEQTKKWMEHQEYINQMIADEAKLKQEAAEREAKLKQEVAEREAKLKQEEDEKNLKKQQETDLKNQEQTFVSKLLSNFYPYK